MEHLNSGTMKHLALRRHCFSVLFACALLGATGCQQRSLPPIHIVVIGVDALSPDGIRNAPTPHIDALIADGAYSATARGVLPTVSSPNWASMINGAGPEQHGIISNAWMPDDYTIEPMVSGVGPVFASIFDLIAEADPDAVTASVYDWGGFGRLYNREAVTIDIDPDGPQATADSAVSVLRAHRPVLTFVHLDHVDGAGHREGHGTPAYYAAVTEADRLIGVVLAGLEAADMRERTTVIITSDHGGVDYGHGGETMAELEIPWIIQGSAVERATTITSPVDTYDTAATIAHLLGLTPPDAWVGRPVYEALSETEPPPSPVLTSDEISHVVVIGVDALSPDGIQKAHTPVLNELIPESAYSFTARGVLTTSSSQNWSSMIMGAGPEQHGITSNAWERDNFSITPTVEGPEGLFPSIFSEVRAAEPGAYIVSIYDWGGFERLFPGSVVDISIDGDGPQDTVDKVRKQFLQHKPRLTFVHLDHVDHAGHTYGHGSDEFYASVSEADRLIGELMEGLEDANMADQTLIIISADHGGLGKGHGGASMQEIEIPWLVHGPGVVAGKKLTVPINIYDTAATVLFALGVEQPYAWIGRPVVSAFDAFSEGEPSSDVYVPAPRIIPQSSGALETDPITITMQVVGAEAAIHYTTDGTEPTAQSPRYTEGFTITNDVIVQAVAIREGHSSMLSRTRYRVLAPGYTQNVSYAYYEGTWEVLPDFDQLKPVRTGSAYEIHLDEVDNRGEDHFAIRFTGTVRISESGRYTFFARSDDGSKVYVNGEEVVNNDGTHGAIERSGQIELEPGLVEVVVDFFESEGGEHLEVFYQGPDMPRKLLTVGDFVAE